MSFLLVTQSIFCFSRARRLAEDDFVAGRAKSVPSLAPISPEPRMPTRIFSDPPFLEVLRMRRSDRHVRIGRCWLQEVDRIDVQPLSEPSATFLMCAGWMSMPSAHAQAGDVDDEP